MRYLAVALLISTAAVAQEAPPAQEGLSVDVTASAGDDLKIAVPVLATDEVRQTPAGGTDALGRQIADVIASDLRGSGLFRPIGPSGIPNVTFGEANAPNYAIWPQTGAEALVSGFVRAGGDGQLTVGCYLYDVNLKSELKRTGFVVAAPVRRKPVLRQPHRLYRRNGPQG
jgi:TolB protein